MQRYNVISADSHVIEPPDLWLKYISPKFRDRAPKGVSLPETDIFEVEGLRPTFVGRQWAAGTPKTEIHLEGRFADAPPSAHDAHARLKYQDQDGVDAEFIYPTLTLRMFAIPDADLMYACLEAYNTWCADFCRAAPDRLKGAVLIAPDDMERGVMELHRARKLGMAGGAIPISPDHPNWYADPKYDRLWAEAQDLDIPISLHVLTERAKVSEAHKPENQLKHRSGALMLKANVGGAEQIQKALGSMILSGVFERFPRLKIVSAENGAGWAVHFLERMDEIVREETALLVEHGLKGDVLPSEYFYRNVLMTFIRDRNAVRCREVVGVDNMMWSSDFPHPNSSFPNTLRVLEEHFVGVPEEDRRKIVCDNARRLYRFGS